MRTSFLLASICLLFSCNPESIQDFTLIPVNQQGDIERIQFLTDDQAYLTGGEDWYHGFSGVSFDGGITWDLDSLTDKKMFALDVSNGEAAISGIDGKYFNLDNGIWQSERTTEWGFVRDLVLLDDGSSITVGGHAYRKGFINKIDTDFEATRLYSEDIEFSAIGNIGNSVLLAAAYGVVLRSVDNGQNWTYTNGVGDFFKDLLYIDDQNIFAVGYNGLILKSEDLGMTWNQSRRLGDFQKSDRLTKIAQIGPTELWVVGKEGLILVSEDLGDSWESKRVDTNMDLRSIAANSDRILIGGTDGFFISIDKQ